MQKPFSQACENNKRPIFQQLSRLIKPTDSVLEIGSGTGQHAVYFAQKMPRLCWQTSDRAENIAGINMWLEEENLANLPAPLTIDIQNYQPLQQKYHHVYSANTLHIMSWSTVELFFKALPSMIKAGGLFITYGPFNYFGQYTSPSNQDFEHWLQQQEPHRGIRDIQALIPLAKQYGLELEGDWAMPANNRLLVFRLLTDE